MWGHKNESRQETVDLHNVFPSTSTKLFPFPTRRLAETRERLSESSFIAHRRRRDSQFRARSECYARLSTRVHLIASPFGPSNFHRPELEVLSRAAVSDLGGYSVVKIQG